jgi:seryl-tRNA synthetase
MTRWLPIIAVVLAVVALGVAVLRQPEVSIGPDELAAVQRDVDAANAVADALAARLHALERTAATEPAVDVQAKVDALAQDVDNLAAGVENACSAIDTLAARIDDVMSALNGSTQQSVPIPPSFGGGGC